MDGGVIQFDDPADEPLLPLSKEITSKEQEGDDDAQHSCKKTEAAPPGPLELENEEYRHTGQKGQAKDEQSELQDRFQQVATPPLFVPSWRIPQIGRHHVPQGMFEKGIKGDEHKQRTRNGRDVQAGEAMAPFDPPDGSRAVDIGLGEKA